MDHVKGRYRPVRRAFKWVVAIGDGLQTHGSFYTKTGAMREAAALQRAYEDGKFMANAEPEYTSEARIGNSLVGIQDHHLVYSNNGKNWKRVWDEYIPDCSVVRSNGSRFLVYAKDDYPYLVSRDGIRWRKV